MKKVSKLPPKKCCFSSEISTDSLGAFHFQFFQYSFSFPWSFSRTNLSLFTFVVQYSIMRSKLTFFLRILYFLMVALNRNFKIRTAVSREFPSVHFCLLQNAQCWFVPNAKLFKFLWTLKVTRMNFFHFYFENNPHTILKNFSIVNFYGTYDAFKFIL